MNQLRIITINRLRAAFAVLVGVFFVATLLQVLFVPCPAARTETAVSRFAALMPKTAGVACSCATCAGHRKGGTCCCETSDSPASALAFRTVCETAPDAALAGTVFPPVLIPRAVVLSGQYPATILCVISLATPRVMPEGCSPLPPHAPPRLFS